MLEPTIQGGLFARFQVVAAARPDAPALLSGSGDVSFHQLRLKAESAAAGLAARGVLPGDRIAIHISRSVHAVAGMLGVGLAGAVAVPLDPSYPMAHRTFVLTDCRPKYVLGSRTAGRAGQTLDASACPVLWLEDLEAEADRSQPLAERPPQTPLYVIYTSGSTGTPKGVVGSAGAAANRIEWMWNAFPFGPAEVLAARTSLAFVDSIWELYGALLAGIPTLVVPPGDSSDPTRLIALLRASRATRITVVPSLLNLFLEAEPGLGNALPSLNLWTSSGEALPRDTAIRFHTAAPNATLLNLYGTTEIAGDATFAVVASPTQPIGPRIPIGRPIAKARCYVLGPDGNHCQTGEEGELYVGGPVIAWGYYNRPEETAARFLPDVEAPGERMYRTGDRVFEAQDGMLYYTGRGDRQVQIRGNRIELEAIENALIGLKAGIEEAIVGAVGPPGELRLVACFAPAVADPGHVSAMLRQVLPEFACPSEFIGMDALPRLPNGKLDRNISRYGPRSAPDAHVSPEDLPATDSERWIAAAWSDLLNVAPVRRTDRFQRLGGDSMQWIRFLLHLSRRQGSAHGLRATEVNEAQWGAGFSLPRALARPASAARPPNRDVLQRSAHGPAGHQSDRSSVGQASACGGLQPDRRAQLAHRTWNVLQPSGERRDSALTMQMSVAEAALLLDEPAAALPAVPADDIVLEQLTHADAEQTAALAAESFLRAEPMARALALPFGEFRLFCRQVVGESLTDGISVVARDRATRKIAGFCLAHAFDAAIPAAAESARIPTMSPILALLRELQAKYVELRGPFDPGEVAEIFMTGCGLGLDTLSLAANMERKVCGLLKAHGYRRVMTVCTHQAAVFLSDRVHHFERVAVIQYAQFTYRNHKPFEQIGSGHSGAVLFEGRL